MLHRSVLSIILSFVLGKKGYIQSIYVDEGNLFQKGQLMFKIMPNLYESDVNRAKAESKICANRISEYQNLSDKTSLLLREMAMAKARYEKAQAELASMNTHLKFTEIRAPFNGIVGKLHVRKRKSCR